MFSKYFKAFWPPVVATVCAAVPASPLPDWVKAIAVSVCGVLAYKGIGTSPSDPGKVK